MNLYNTLSRKVELFTPLSDKTVTMYSCGPTVYDYTHIGHMRKFIMDDVLKRTLVYLGYNVRHVMNITDVGHLSSDADSGVDKLEKGAAKTGKTVWEVAEYYTKFFEDTMSAVGVQKPDVTCRATDNIDAMISLIKELEQKGYTYKTDEAVYFNVAKFAHYGELSGQRLEEKMQGARDEVHLDVGKVNPADFALWFFRVGRFADHTMHWDSPWGDGFPGWHIECSAMSMKYLGETLDIHTGGVDHIPVHHENEIAQSEGATGHKFVRFWVHHQFLTIRDEKMSKSLGNFFTILDIVKEGIDPLSLRLLFLQTHYRQRMDFTFEAAKASDSAYQRLKNHMISLKESKDTESTPSATLEEYRAKFIGALEDDMDTPRAVALMWEVVKSDLPDGQIRVLLLEFDQVFGLGLKEVKEEEIPAEIIALAKERTTARTQKDFARGDVLRAEIEAKGYLIEDTGDTFKLKPIK